MEKCYKRQLYGGTRCTAIDLNWVYYEHKLLKYVEYVEYQIIRSAVANKLIMTIEVKIATFS